MEKWRDIPGLEDRFQASTEGRIRSLDRYIPNGGCRTPGSTCVKFRRGQILAQASTGRYLIVTILQTAKYVHRLVAKTWKKNPLNLPQVNHKSGIRIDNRPVNLEWCTAKYNMQHAVRTGLKKSYKMTRKTKLLISENNSKKVVDIKTGVQYKNMTTAAKINKISLPQVSMKLNGKIYNNTTLRFA